MNGRGWLERLVEQAWSLFRKTGTAGHGVVVQPSVPILFFGDSRAYETSPLKIITVGLNPSKIEFDGPDPFHRFPLARTAVREDSFTDYVAALDAYFETDPYKNWFSCYEPLLNGLDASYYKGAASTVLHTDICSPVATDPTWTGLDRQVKRALWEDGRALWHDLARALAPDLIIVSVAKEYASGIEFAGDGARVAFTLDRKNPYQVTARDVEVVSGTRTVLVAGKAAQKPFGTVSDRDKHAIGRALKDALHHA